MKFIYIVLIFIAAYLTRIPVGLTSINVSDDDTNIDISRSLKLAHIELANFPSNISQIAFIPNSENILKLGYTSSNNLLKFEINNTLPYPIEKYFYLNSLNGTLKLFRIDGKGNLFLIGKGGTDLPRNQRFNNSLVGAIKFNLEPGPHQYLVSLISRHNISANVFLGTEKSLEKFENQRLSFFNFYVGGIVLLILYNFFLFITSREKVYLFYIYYTSSFLIMALTINCRFDQLMDLGDISFSHYLLSFSANLLLAGTIFTSAFLEIEKRIPKLIIVYKAIGCLAIFLLFIGLTNIADKYSVFFGILIDVGIFLSLIFFNACGIYLYHKLSTAKFYLISWLLVLISAAIWFAMKLNLLPINFFTINALPIGSMAEMLTLALALAYKINTLTAEKFAALERARDKEKYQRLVRVLSHDIANSLTIITAYTKKLQITEAKNSSIQNCIDKINYGTENIVNILEIVRDQETSHAGNQLELTNVNVLHCLEFSKTLNEDLLALKNIQLNISIPGHLSIMADKTSLINNVFNNIISNAIKFSYPGSCIDIFYETPHEDSIIISFKDYGVGIPNNSISKIFYTSETFSTPGTKNELGHGLGTNIIQEYMSLFGGKLEVISKTEAEDKINHGTLIKLYFSTNA